MTNEVFFLTITILIFILSQKIYKKVNFFLLNPLLLSITAIIIFLVFFKIDYKTYMTGGKFISFLLAPAVVSLAVPLYLQLERIKKNKVSILLSISAGAITGVVSSAVMAILFKGSKDIVLSIIPKSVTTPIAIDVSSKIGGIPSLTVVTVVITGLTGVIFGVPFLKLLGVTSTKAVGLAMGTASHGSGTARVTEIDKEYGAYGGIAIAICGVITALVAPIFVKIISY